MDEFDKYMRWLESIGVISGWNKFIEDQDENGKNDKKEDLDFKKTGEHRGLNCITKAVE